MCPEKVKTFESHLKNVCLNTLQSIQSVWHWTPLFSWLLYLPDNSNQFLIFSLHFFFFCAFQVVPCHHISFIYHPVSLRTLHLVLSIPVLMKKLFPVQNGNSRALVTGRSLFRRPLSGTVFLPTSDTDAPSHSSKLPLGPSSSLLPSPSSLDSLEDKRFPPPLIDCWCLCVADLSVRARVTDRRRDRRETE